VGRPIRLSRSEIVANVAPSDLAGRFTLTSFLLSILWYPDETSRLTYLVRCATFNNAIWLR
jgi:hypothetical protein